MIDFILNNILDIIFVIISLPLLIVIFDVVFAIANKQKFSLKTFTSVDSTNERNVKLFMVTLVIYWIVLIGGINIIS